MLTRAPVTIGANTKLPQLDVVPDGNIILIRFIRSDRMLDVFGEKFKVSKNLVYAYVKEVIITEIHQLQIDLELQIESAANSLRNGSQWNWSRDREQIS